MTNLKLINKMIEIINNEGDFLKKEENGSYVLNMEYGWSSFIIDSLLNNNSVLTDYYLGEKYGQDKYEYFENEKELMVFLSNTIASYFENLSDEIKE